MEKRMKKTAGLGALCIMALVLFVGCKKSFDASDYVKAVLDLDIKGDAGPIKKYAQDQEDLEEMKADSAKEWEKMAEGWFDGFDLSEETQQEWQGLLADILKNAKYTVREAEETEKGYRVKVDVEPISGIFEDLETPVKEGCASYYNAHKEGVMDGTTPEGEIDEGVCKVFFDVVREKMEGLTYADAQTVTVEIETEDEQSVSGLEEVGAHLIDLTKLDGFNLWGIWRETVGFDAAGFVRATLDLSTKGDIDAIKAYLADPDEVTQDYYQQYWDELFSEIYDEVGLSDEMMDRLQGMYMEILGKTRYTVGEAVEAGEHSYTVDVAVEPVAGIFDGLWEAIEGEMTAYAQANVEGIANGTVTDTDIYNASIDMLMEAARKNMDNAYYKEAQTVTVGVEEEEGSYEISEEDLEKVYGVMVDTSGLDGFF